MASRALAVGLLGAAVAGLSAYADDAGKRDFPATLVVDEPQVETEIAPQIAAWRLGGADRVDLGDELSLQLAKPVSVIVRPTYTVLRPGGSGFQALEIGTKYEFVANAEHEIVVSASVSGSLGEVGSKLVGANTDVSVIPTLYLGKGGGDLPEGLAWARPFALTGQIGFEVPSRPRMPGDPGGDPANPYTLSVLGSLQYSLPYAAANVPSLTPSGALAQLVPLVECEIEIPVANIGFSARTLGTIDPGVLWIDAAHHTTWGLEALVPLNRASGSHPGARLQLSYSFDAPWPLAGDAPR